MRNSVHARMPKGKGLMQLRCHSGAPLVGLIILFFAVALQRGKPVPEANLRG
jgi:hypothetical protein